MPWHTNSSLQLHDMYNQVYSYLIASSKCRDTILHILGQVVIARSMSSDVDIFGTPANSSSTKRLTLILGLEHAKLKRAIVDVRWLFELGDRDQDIRVQHTSFLEFLLDQSRSGELYVDVNKARMIFRQAAIRWIFNAEGM